MVVVRFERRGGREVEWWIWWVLVGVVVVMHGLRRTW